MRMSEIYSPTLREVPSEAEVVSHKLMLRAGLLRKSAAGIYTYLPLGYRVIKKIMNIIREEMDGAGGQEILLPIIQPAELWHESGRWNDYGDEMFRLKDRNAREFCLGPTHEEIITALIRSEVRSYRQLPLRLYQIQNKYRDEIRPRFGLIRGREFIMKDLYSFDRDEAGLDASYQAMYHAYERIFERCGLVARPVEADAGAIGGENTHEFMVLAEAAGEALVLYCNNCDYAANVEKAKCEPTELDPKKGTAPLEEVETPGASTIEQVSSFLNIPKEKCVKTMVYLADGQPIAVLLRGDHTLNEIKLQHLVDCHQLELASHDIIEQVTGAPVGFTGPVGLKGIKLIVDHAVMAVTDGVTGANKDGFHLQNVNVQRDFSPSIVADIRNAQPEDPCPKCQTPLKGASGIEVGQVFKLGTKYSIPLKASFLDENGKDKPLVMGCYGIGVSRTLAAVIEQNHDENGICWPIAVAPFHAIVVPVSMKDETQKEVANSIYEQLVNANIEVVLDDRNERPGVKFKDADLIGFPVRITIGPKALEQGNVELTLRSTNETHQVSKDEVVQKIIEFIGR